MGSPVPDIEFVSYAQMGVGFSVYDTLWIPSTAKVLFVGQTPSAKGTMRMFGLNEGKMESVAQSSKLHPLKAACVVGSGETARHAATGDFRGNLCVWDLEDLTLPVWNARAHESIINAVRSCGKEGRGAPELVSCGRDGSVKVWDVRVQDAVVSMKPAGDKVDCWSVSVGNSFADDQRTVTAGFSNGDVCMVDMRTRRLCWQTNLGSGVCSLDYADPHDPQQRLLATTTYGKFSVFELTKETEKTAGDGDGADAAPFPVYHRVDGQMHEPCTVWAGAHLPQHSWAFATAGGNGALEMHYFERSRTDTTPGSTTRLCSHTVSKQPITTFAWHPQREGLCAFGSLDQCVQVGVFADLASKLHPYSQE